MEKKQSDVRLRTGLSIIDTKLWQAYLQQATAPSGGRRSSEGLNDPYSPHPVTDGDTPVQTKNPSDSSNIGAEAALNEVTYSLIRIAALAERLEHRINLLSRRVERMTNSLTGTTVEAPHG